LFGGGQANLFGYVNNDPINFIDPKGESYSGFLSDAAAIVFLDLVRDSAGKGRSTMQQLREAYTREILFDTGGTFDPKPGGQCPLPTEATPKNRLVPFTPQKGYPDHTWRSPGV
jgi:hypothetical protein